MSAALYAQKPTWFDDNGDPLTGGKVYLFEPGTATPIAIYSDSALSMPSENPIILNSRGQPSTPIFLAEGATFDIQVTDADDVAVESAQGIVLPLTTGTTAFASAAEVATGTENAKAVTPLSGASAYDRKAVAAAHTAGKSTTRVVLVPSGGAVTPNLALSNVFRVGAGTPAKLTGNVTINNPTGPLSGQGIAFIMQQDATGGRTVTWGSKYLFVNGVATLSTAANDKNKVVCLYDADDDRYLCEIGADYT